MTISSVSVPAIIEMGMEMGMGMETEKSLINFMGDGTLCLSQSLAMGMVVGVKD